MSSFRTVKKNLRYSMDNYREYYHASRGKTKPRHLANTGDSTTTLKLHLEAAHCCSSNLTLDSGSVGHNIKSVVNFPELWKCRDHCHYFPSGQMSSTFCLGLCKLISTKSTFFFSIISINFVCSVKRKRALLRSNPPRDSRANENRWEAQSQCLVEMLPIFVFKVIFVVMPLKPSNLDKRLAYLCFFVSESGTSAFSFCG